MLTGCDYDPTFCEQGPSMTSIAFVIIGIILAAAILYEIITGLIAARGKKKEYPDTWLD